MTTKRTTLFKEVKVKADTKNGIKASTKIKECRCEAHQVALMKKSGWSDSAESASTTVDVTDKADK